jgi:hypothetical protein
VKTKFSATFEKQLGFHTSQNRDVKGKLCMTDSLIGNLFYRLLYATWTKLHQDNINGMTEQDDFLEYENEYSTNELYLHHEPRTVKNEDIVGFAANCIKVGLFVGNAYGFKTFYSTTPSGYLDICEAGKLSEFSQLGTESIMANLPQNFNQSAFPDYISNPGINQFRHDLCHVIYGIDIGHEVTPMNENLSLIPSGYSGKRYLKEMLKIERTAMVRAVPLTDGTFHQLHKCFTKVHKNLLFDSHYDTIFPQKSYHILWTAKNKIRTDRFCKQISS